MVNMDLLLPRLVKCTCIAGGGIGVLLAFVDGGLGRSARAVRHFPLAVLVRVRLWHERPQVFVNVSQPDLP